NQRDGKAPEIVSGIALPLVLADGRIRSSLNRRDRKARELSESQRQTLVKNHAYHVGLLIDAIRQKSPHMLWILDGAIQERLSELETRFGLEETVKNLRENQIKPEILKDLAQYRPPAELRQGQVH